MIERRMGVKKTALIVVGLWPAVVVACTGSPYPPPMVDCDGACLPYNKDASLVKDSMGDAGKPDAYDAGATDGAKDVSTDSDAPID